MGELRMCELMCELKMGELKMGETRMLPTLLQSATSLLV